MVHPLLIESKKLLAKAIQKLNESHAEACEEPYESL